MNKLLLASCCAAAATVSAQNVDTTRVNRLGEALVVTNRATAKTPIAFSNLGKAEIAQVNKGQDIPFLLSALPNVIVTSDAGNGIGYTSLRVRGTEATRINVTANGIPMNDAESHGLFWVNMGDFASSLNDLQLQRGVGTSTNGAAAFGASLNMTTDKSSLLPHAEVNLSAGSFGTTKNTLKFGTGLLNNHWSFDGRLSYLSSEGYRDRGWTRLGSYFTQAGYFNNGTVLKLIAFGGKEKTYHAWDGISRKQLTGAERTYNPNGKYEMDGKTYFYDDQTDNYFQQHAQALLTQRLNDAWNLTANLHYTYGRGFYEEYKDGRTLTKFNLTPYTLNGTTVKKSDLVRRKEMENHFFGGNVGFNYKQGAWDVATGVGANHYEGNHFGRVLWVKNYQGNLHPNHEYYRNKGQKFDGNAYLRANFAATAKLNLFADLQYRFINYEIKGTSDKKPVLNTDVDFHFFNPKLGLTWTLDNQQQIYASAGIAQREPARNNYTEAYSNHDPKSEHLTDFEVGYRYKSDRWEASVGGYWMNYRDQLVLNGRMTEIGEAILENVDRSYRAGVELAGAWNILSCLRWDANLSLSTNRIKDYTAYLYDLDVWLEEKNQYLEFERKVGNTTISFSPSVVANNRFAFRRGPWAASLTTQYVSRQYLDNMAMKENSLDAYCVSHLNASYDFALRGTKGVTVGLTVYNLFDHEYETNGYSQTSIDNTTGNLSSDPRFYPMAGRNVLFNVAVRF